jgi:hypothetical protein
MWLEDISEKPVTLFEIPPAAIEDETPRDSVADREKQLHHIVNSKRPADELVKVESAKLARAQEIRELERAPDGRWRRWACAGAPARKGILEPVPRVRIPDCGRLFGMAR